MFWAMWYWTYCPSLKSSYSTMTPMTNHMLGVFGKCCYVYCMSHLRTRWLTMINFPPKEKTQEISSLSVSTLNGGSAQKRETRPLVSLTASFMSNENHPVLMLWNVVTVALIHPVRNKMEHKSIVTISLGALSRNNLYNSIIFIKNKIKCRKFTQIISIRVLG